MEGTTATSNKQQPLTVELLEHLIGVMEDINPNPAVKIKMNPKFFKEMLSHTSISKQDIDNIGTIHNMQYCGLPIEFDKLIKTYKLIYKEDIEE